MCSNYKPTPHLAWIFSLGLGDQPLVFLKGGQNEVWGLSSMCAGVFVGRAAGQPASFCVAGFWTRLGLDKFFLTP